MCSTADMTKASQQVANTYELLEAVLLQLPPQDLIRAQAVSKSFAALITRSPRLQRNLRMECPGQNPLEPEYLPLRKFLPPVFHSITIRRTWGESGRLDLIAVLDLRYLSTLRGGSYEKLLLYRPETTSIVLSPPTYSHWRHTNNMHAKNHLKLHSSSGGLTLGDLVAFAKKLEELEPHKKDTGWGQLELEIMTDEDGSTEKTAAFYSSARDFDGYVQTCHRIINDALTKMIEMVQRCQESQAAGHKLSEGDMAGLREYRKGVLVSFRAIPEHAEKAGVLMAMMDSFLAAS